MDDLLRVGIVLVLVGANAFFVIGEYAVLTARRAALAPRVATGSKRAAAVLRLMDDPVRVISTVQVGITAVGILIGAVGEPVVSDLLGESLPRWLTFLIAFGVVTYLSVVLGELVPKALTLHSAERLAMLVARPIDMLGRVLRPAVWVLQGSARAVLRPFGVTEVMAGESIRSVEELRAVVDEAEGSGVIPRAQEELIYNVFDFASREAVDAMLPSAEVEWLDGDIAVSDAIEQTLATNHERFPVGTGALDRIVGVVVHRDLVREVRERPTTKVREVAREAVVVPETKDLGALLRELREAGEEMAIVADEYGRTSGIVTVADIVDEILGGIESQFELPDATVTRVDEAVVEVAGSISIDDFNESTGTDLPREGARTLAGLVFSSLGRSANAGDVVEVANVTLRVEQVDGARIVRIRAELPKLSERD